MGGYANISGLEPARSYVFIIRNVSRELLISSNPTGLKQTMRKRSHCMHLQLNFIPAPIITSTIYPGQISSTALNINFDETDNEHVFDSYELVFFGGTKGNFTKKLPRKNPYVS